MRPRLGTMIEVDHDVCVLQGYIIMRALLEFFSFPKQLRLLAQEVCLCTVGILGCISSIIVLLRGHLDTVLVLTTIYVLRNHASLEPFGISHHSHNQTYHIRNANYRISFAAPKSRGMQLCEPPLSSPANVR